VTKHREPTPLEIFVNIMTLGLKTRYDQKIERRLDNCDPPITSKEVKRDIRRQALVEVLSGFLISIPAFENEEARNLVRNWFIQLAAEELFHDNIARATAWIDERRKVLLGLQETNHASQTPSARVKSKQTADNDPPNPSNDTEPSGEVDRENGSTPETADSDENENRVDFERDLIDTELDDFNELFQTDDCDILGEASKLFHQLAAQACTQDGDEAKKTAIINLASSYVRKHFLTTVDENKPGAEKLAERRLAHAETWITNNLDAAKEAAKSGQKSRAA
jgi:hypothetical protein